MEEQIKRMTNAKLNFECDFPMNTLKISIPYSYFIKLVELNWYDILFAIENGFLVHQAAIEHAMWSLANEEYPQAVLDLACIKPKEAVHPYEILEYLKELTKQISDKEKAEAKNKVMYVLLSWVFENKEHYKEPLSVVEFIYDDFNFPKAMVSFVRYMPTDQPLLSTVEASIERLYNNWKDYLEKQADYWKK